MLCMHHALTASDFKGDEEFASHLPEGHGDAPVDANPPGSVHRLGGGVGIREGFSSQFFEVIIVAFLEDIEDKPGGRESAEEA